MAPETENDFPPNLVSLVVMHVFEDSDYFKSQWQLFLLLLTRDGNQLLDSKLTWKLSISVSYWEIANRKPFSL